MNNKDELLDAIIKADFEDRQYIINSLLKHFKKCRFCERWLKYSMFDTIEDLCINCMSNVEVNT